MACPGLAFIEEYRRVYPVGATASHVVGLVDVDNRGLAGIEKFIDDNPQLTMSDEEAVTISLDLGAQHVLREELGKAIKTYRAKAAAGIVIDVHSGEVLALVSLPDYDPNRREQALDKDRLEPHRLRRLRDGLGVQGVHRRRRARHRACVNALALRRLEPDPLCLFHHRRLPRPASQPERAGSVHLFVEYRRRQDGARHGRRSPPRFPQEARPDEPGSDRDRRERRADHPDALAEAQHHDHCLRPWHVGDAAPARGLDAASRQWRDRRRPQPSCRARARRAWRAAQECSSARRARRC